MMNSTGLLVFLIGSFIAVCAFFLQPGGPQIVKREADDDADYTADSADPEAPWPQDDDQ